MNENLMKNQNIWREKIKEIEERYIAFLLYLDKSEITRAHYEN